MKQILTVIAFIIFVSTVLTGWVLNIYKLFHAPEIHGMEIARAVGVFMAPLGSILGWC